MQGNEGTFISIKKTLMENKPYFYFLDIFVVLVVDPFTGTKKVKFQEGRNGKRSPKT